MSHREILWVAIGMVIYWVMYKADVALSMSCTDTPYWLRGRSPLFKFLSTVCAGPLAFPFGFLALYDILHHRYVLRVKAP